MAQVIWHAHALADLEQIHEFIETRSSPSRADAVIQRIIGATRRLATFPLSGRLIEDPQQRGFREVVTSDFIIGYVVAGDEVRILSVQHGARGMPEETHEPEAVYAITA